MIVASPNANHRRSETSSTPVIKNDHFRGTIYQFYSKKQQKNNVDIANSDSELTDLSSQSDNESYYSDIAGTEIDIERNVSQKNMFLFYKKVSKESHKNEQKKTFAEMKDNNEKKQEEPKTKKTKTINRNTSKPGSFKYKTKFSTVLSSTWSCIQPVDADICAGFCTV